MLFDCCNSSQDHAWHHLHYIHDEGFGDTIVNIVLYLWYCCGSTVGKQGQYVLSEYVFVC